ncbi:MAG: DUF4188 domain-containing protein [Thermaceae bacterium]|nr:DUF4188 domain-containing protein [Thermaceae bacterium]
MIQTGRFTAKHQGPLVVFLIGMRVNNWLKPREWLPVFSAMGPMISYLYQHPESGFLGGLGPIFSLGMREVTLVQYWHSAEDLERFARQDPNLHPEAWKRFFRSSFKGGAVGIWHETYKVEAGAFESVYGNMPSYGLGKATKAVPIKGKLETMRGRLATDSAQDAGMP